MEKKLVDDLNQMRNENIYCFERYVQLILKKSLHDKVYIDYYYYLFTALDRWYISVSCFYNLKKNWPDIIGSILKHKRPGETEKPKSYIIKIVTSEIISNII